jgi:rfaE bifunctional protein nucleotidyltransferase chain/domain
MGEIILDQAELARRVEAAKRAGKRVIFTNGGFDILHVGHIRALEGAKALGDLLVVALNSDASIRGYKGEGLPIMPEAERAELVAAFRCVDLVTVFSEPTVDRLLLLLKPHVHAKGTDYTKQAIPEAATVASYGGEIAIVGDPKGHSSSWILERIKKVEVRDKRAPRG